MAGFVLHLVVIAHRCGERVVGFASGGAVRSGHGMDCAVESRRAVKGKCDRPLTWAVWEKRSPFRRGDPGTAARIRGKVL